MGFIGKGIGLDEGVGWHPVVPVALWSPLDPDPACFCQVVGWGLGTRSAAGTSPLSPGLTGHQI